MIEITKRVLRDGSISLRIGTEITRLQTGGEVDAFMAGVNIAHAALAHKIGDLLALNPALATKTEVKS